MSAHKIRVLADSKTTTPILDHNTNDPLFWWRGNDLEIDFALANHGQFLTSADIGTITVLVKAVNAGPDDSPLMLKTLGAGDCDPLLTAPTWADKRRSLATASFSRAEAAVDAGDYKLIITHNDGSGNRNTHLSSRVTVKEDQHDSISLSAPPPPPAEYYTEEESDGRFLSFGTGQTLTPNQKAQLSENWPDRLGRGIEFEDDFERADTSPGVISNAPGGFVYDVRDEGSASNLVQIVDGEVTDSLLGGTYYLGGQCIADQVSNMGAEVIWREPVSGSGAGANTALVLIIKNNDNWLTSLIHIIVTRANVSVQVAESDGVAGFVEISSENTPRDENANFAWHQLPLDETQKVEALIEGDRLTVLVNGAVRCEVTDSRIKTLNGNRLYWECFGGSISDDMYIRRIWANDFREEGFSGARYQGRSKTLDLLSQGILDLYSHARLRNGNLTVESGDILASKIKGRSVSGGTAGGQSCAPVLHGNFAELHEPVESSASASDEDLYTNSLVGNTMAQTGSHLKIIAMGKFAANGESKTIKYNLSGDRISATTNINDGQWKLEVWISATTSVSHDCFAQITLSDGTIVMESWELNGGAAQIYTSRIKATATTAGSVVLSKHLAIMHHSRDAIV